MGRYNGYGYVPYKTYTPEQEARYKKLSQREYAQAPHSGKSHEKDSHFVALPAGWRKSSSGRWYFENRRNRTDDLAERQSAWNGSMSNERKGKTFKHIHVDSKVVLGLGGQPEYARYVVRYGDFLGHSENKVASAKSLLAGQKKYAERKAHQKLHTGAGYNKKTYRKVMGGNPIASYEGYPRTRVGADTLLKATYPKFREETMVKIPAEYLPKTSARKSNARKNVSLAAYGVDAEVAKAVKKITAKKSTAKKPAAKKTTAKKTAKK